MKDSRLTLHVLTTLVLLSGNLMAQASSSPENSSEAIFDEIELLSEKEVAHTLSPDQAAQAPSKASSMEASLVDDELVLTFPEPVIPGGSEPFFENTEELASFAQPLDLQVEVETIVPDFTLASSPEAFDFPSMDAIASNSAPQEKSLTHEFPALPSLEKSVAMPEAASPSESLAKPKSLKTRVETSEKKNSADNDESFVESLATAPNLPLMEEKTPKKTIAQSEKTAALAHTTPAVVPANWEFAEAILSKQAIDWKAVFAGSPMIYSLLGLLSFAAVGISIYSAIQLNVLLRTSENVHNVLQSKLLSNHFDDVQQLCAQSDSFLCRMLQSGLSARKQGPQVLWEAMRQEGKRISISFWHRLSLLNDIAMIAPMIGLLGTVVGMFYAFYDINRSTESVRNLFDGLGISIGTTVSGLVVAVLAMALHAIGKYRLTRSLATVEQEALNMARLIDNRVSPSDNG